MHRCQAAEPDGLAICTYPIGQLITGFETLRLLGQFTLVRFQHQCVEGLEGTGAVVACIEVYRAACQAQLLPILDPPREDVCQLFGGELWQGIIGVDEHCNTIQTDHLLGTGCTQITQRLELAHLGIVDGARRCGQVGLAMAKRDKAGARAVRRDVDAQRLALGINGGYHGLVCHSAWPLLDRRCLLCPKMPLHQRRQQGRADGVGTLHAQVHRLGHGRQGEQGKQQEQQTEHAGRPLAQSCPADYDSGVTEM
ncbi:hypothetical protein D3C78_514620 [compost metagenome]